MTVARIQDTLGNCCQGIKNATIASATWIGKTVTSGAHMAVEGAKKVADYAKPHFAQARNFTRDNKSHLIVAAVCIVGSAIVTSLILSHFSKSRSPASTATA